MKTIAIPIPRGVTGKMNEMLHIAIADAMAGTQTPNLSVKRPPVSPANTEDAEKKISIKEASDTITSLIETRYVGTKVINPHPARADVKLKRKDRKIIGIFIALIYNVLSIGLFFVLLLFSSLNRNIIRNPQIMPGMADKRR
jgi:hypothetical protein